MRKESTRTVILKSLCATIAGFFLIAQVPTNAIAEGSLSHNQRLHEVNNNNGDGLKQDIASWQSTFLNQIREIQRRSTLQSLEDEKSYIGEDPKKTGSPTPSPQIIQTAEQAPVTLSEELDKGGYPIIVTSNQGVLPTQSDGPFVVSHKQGVDGAEESVQYQFPSSREPGETYIFIILNSRADTHGLVGDHLIFSVKYAEAGYDIIITGALPESASEPFTVIYKEGEDGAQKSKTFSFPQGAADGDKYTFTIENTRQDALGNTGDPLIFNVVYDIPGYNIIVTSGNGNLPSFSDGPFEVTYREGPDGTEQSIYFDFPTDPTEGTTYFFEIPNRREDANGHIGEPLNFGVVYNTLGSGYPILVTSGGGLPPIEAPSKFTVSYTEGIGGAEQTTTFQFPLNAADGDTYTFIIMNQRPDNHGTYGENLLFHVKYNPLFQEPPEEPSYTALLEKVMEGYSLPVPTFSLNDPKLNELIDYSLYGTFQNLGTTEYQYLIEDPAGLNAAVGAGIYPDGYGVLTDPRYIQLENAGLLNGSHWDYLGISDYERAFYKWATAPEDPGAKLYFTASILEKAGHLAPAIKAYYAALVHFNKSVCWGSDGSFVWYIAPAAISAIQRICRDYTALGLDFEGAYFDVQNGDDTNLSNDIITFNPGRLISKTLEEKLADLPDLKSLGVVETRGSGEVTLVKYSNGHWQLQVDKKPYLVKGITYSPTEVGLGPQSDPRLFSDRWMFSDINQNGLIDAPYDAWVDKNMNGIQDADEPSVGDFQLLKDMGINTIRLYAPNDPITEYNPSAINKPLLRDLYETYGIRVVVGDYLGAYTIGSGASWEEGTDYTDPVQRQNMMDVVRAKVMDLKDEPFVLMWVLGNENNMDSAYSGVNATRTNASVYPKEYAEFLNEVAQMIHTIDPNHPVMVGNAAMGLVEYYEQYAPAIDILGMNSYRGYGGFGGSWEEAQSKFDRAVLVSEYGCDAYAVNYGVDEAAQAHYHSGNVRDIVYHIAGGPFTGNSIGGIIFEYLDEWWKDTQGNPEDQHQTQPQFPFPSPDGYSHEEWFGIAGQGNGQDSPFLRELRSAYFYYQDLWTQ